MKMEQSISCSRVIDKFQVDIQDLDMEKVSSATMIFPQAKVARKTMFAAGSNIQQIQNGITFLKPA